MSLLAPVEHIPAESNSPPAPLDFRPDMATTPPKSDGAAAADAVDSCFHAAMARFTGGLSPAALALAFADWQLHLLASPGKQAALAGEAFQNASSLSTHGAEACDVSAVVIDQAAGERPPLHRTGLGVAALQSPGPGLPADRAMVAFDDIGHSRTGATNAAIADFALRQCLDMVAPTNFPWPAIQRCLRKIMETGGGNFVAGLHNWIEDCQALLAGGKPRDDQKFVVGKDVAVTPGKVVYRNELIELIQYAPTTPTVRPEPVLIVPAWIMKYYILDLSPHNSLVRFLVEQRLHRLHDLLEESDGRRSRSQPRRLPRSSGSMRRSMPSTRSCPGAGDPCRRLLPRRHAAVDRRRPAGRAIGPDCLRSVTLLAAQTDFTEAGELTLFINESQVAFLEDMMWRQGCPRRRADGRRVPDVALATT